MLTIRSRTHQLGTLDLGVYLLPETPTRRYNRGALWCLEDYVYVLVSADDRVLYVGITGNPVERWRTHAQKKPWWPEVARIHFAHGGKTWQALRWEMHLIRELRPIYNIRGAVHA